MPIAANASVLRIGASATPTVEADGIKSSDWPIQRDSLDTTAKNDGAFRGNILGLLGFEITLSGDWEPADASQTLLRTSLTSGATVYVRELFDGTAGFEAGFKVTSFKIGSEVSGLVQMTCTLKSTTDLTVI
jgi:predicted secreted protein